MEQKYIGAVESVAYGTMRVLGSVARSMSEIFYWIFPIRVRQSAGPSERPSAVPEARPAKTPPPTHVEPSSPLTHYEAPLPPRIIVPVVIKDPIVQQVAAVEKKKEVELDNLMHGIEFASKMERLKAETYTADFRSQDKEVRVKSLEQIKKLSGKAALGILKKLLSSSKESLHTIEIISALGEISDIAVLDKRIFVDFLGDRNPSVRQAAIRALARYKDDESFSYVSGSLSDKEAEVRRQALNCLAWFFGPKCAPAIVKCMHDIDAGVRKTAAHMSGSMKLKQAISGLITLLSDSDHGVQKAASDSIMKITGQDYGFRVNGSPKSKREGIDGWRFWWRDNQSKFMVSK